MWAIKIIPQQELFDCTLAVYELPSSETHTFAVSICDTACGFPTMMNYVVKNR